MDNDTYEQFTVPGPMPGDDELYLFEMLEPEIVPLLRARHPFVQANFHSAANALEDSDLGMVCCDSTTRLSQRPARSGARARAAPAPSPARPPQQSPTGRETP